ncbi:MAG: hypothetical protein AB1585_03410 [Thermodesulfobacteriota bacterium]
MAKKKEINERGTPLWSLNLLRSDLLPSLLDDLFLAESTGFTDAHCTEVKKALSKLVNAATLIPDGGFLTRTVWDEFQRFEIVYHDWNSLSGDHDAAKAHRRNHLMRLRKQRHRISKRIRNNQHILSNELDLKLLSVSHQAMADLVGAVPNLFVELSKAIARFAVKQGKIT